MNTDLKAQIKSILRKYIDQYRAPQGGEAADHDDKWDGSHVEGLAEAPTEIVEVENGGE